jgi:DtxR family Mn-dependent transcriptional regulator
MYISKEDYLRVLYELNEKCKDNIKSIDIAKKLEITKPSVTQMINKFKEQELVKSKPYSRIKLTNKGLKEAKRIMHNHRVIEVFLKKVLKYEIKNVHDEANRLEHAFSEESIRRIDSLLSNPKKSPHGKEIPH